MSCLCAKSWDICPNMVLHLEVFHRDVLSQCICFRDKAWL